jgi:hypothetical protein
MTSTPDLIDAIWTQSWVYPVFDVLAACIWGGMTYVAWRRGSVRFGRFLPEIRRDDRRDLFHMLIGAGVAITAVAVFGALAQGAAWLIGRR